MYPYTDLESINNHAKPLCVKVMQTEFIEYVPGVSISCLFPVLESYSNARKSMQGGFICAAFDNAFGALVYLTTERMDVATIDMNLCYHKPIYEKDQLTVTVYIKSQGKTIINLNGEAFDREGNLIATALTNVFISENKQEIYTVL